ncbi:hypothetical protein GXM_03649 [Nostoc sphaeroides CCNUC1]|uniref:Uncharacterized protein n=1 Tax=Nostoc sphaeroides CCNUC1 TaxID=2653204 RepID=A0A5P8W2D3_9NOSO|nr:hypothetical protein GXM_03649 [Nostoc sphaeroides CCNUC1]
MDKDAMNSVSTDGLFVAFFFQNGIAVFTLTTRCYSSCFNKCFNSV